MLRLLNMIKERRHVKEWLVRQEKWLRTDMSKVL